MLFLFGSIDWFNFNRLQNRLHTSNREELPAPEVGLGHYGIEYFYIFTCFAAIICIIRVSKPQHAHDPSTRSHTHDTITDPTPLFE